jgi:V/A-type H+/Na+-transporting ATPase subunit E
MATTLEDFVAKLHSEGVATGRAEAERLLAVARQEADSIRRAAESEAAEIVKRARSDAAAEKARTETDLRLAVRDALLGLRSALTNCLDAVVRRSLAEPLRDDSVVVELVTQVVREYARAEASGARHIEIRVPEQLVERVRERVLGDLASSSAAVGLGVDVRGSLCDSGFEYRLAGATVDVGMDAVAERVRELVRPALWELLDEAVAEADGDAASHSSLAPAGSG